MLLKNLSINLLSLFIFDKHIFPFLIKFTPRAVHSKRWTQTTNTLFHHIQAVLLILATASWRHPSLTTQTWLISPCWAMLISYFDPIGLIIYVKHPPESCHRSPWRCWWKPLQHSRLFWQKSPWRSDHAHEQKLLLPLVLRPFWLPGHWKQTQIIIKQYCSY